jgi:hypothetical protein
LALPPKTAQITSQEAVSFPTIQLFVARAGKALAGATAEGLSYSTVIPKIFNTVEEGACLEVSQHTSVGERLCS